MVLVRAVCCPRLHALLHLVVAALLGVILGCGAPDAPQRRPSADDELAALETHLAEHPDDIAAYVALAQRQINYRGNPQRAAVLAQRCVENNPNRAEALLAGAEILRVSGENPLTCKAWAEAYVRLEPADERGYLLLADVQRGSPTQALAALDQGLAALTPRLESPANPSASLKDKLAILRLIAAKAQYLVLLGRYTPARQTLDGALTDSRFNGLPGLWQLDDLAARLDAVLLNTPSSAIERLKHRLRREPVPEVIQTLAWLWLLRQEAEIAVPELIGLLKQVEMPAARHMVYVCLAQAEVLRGDLQTARSHVNRSLEIIPDSKVSLLLGLQIATLQADTGQQDRLRLAGRLTELRVQPFRMPAALGTLQAAMRGVFAQHFYEFERSRLEFEAAYQAEPNVAWLALALAQLAQQHEKFNDAIRWLRLALGEPSLAPEVNCSLGDCYLRLGDYKNALRHYQEALDASPNNPRAWRGKQRAESLRPPPVRELAPEK